MLGANSSAQVVRHGTIARKNQLLHRQRSRQMAHQSPPIRPRQLPRNLSRRGFDLLRKPAATGIGLRYCPRRKPPHRLNLKSQGARESRLDPQGNLVLATAAGNVQLLHPVVYQVDEGHEARRSRPLRSAGQKTGLVLKSGNTTRAKRSSSTLFLFTPPTSAAAAFSQVAIPDSRLPSIPPAPPM